MTRLARRGGTPPERRRTASPARNSARPRTDESAGHPTWCAGDHRCTAAWSTGGQHASIPEVWVTSHGRVVGTRHRDADTGRDWLEIRITARLATDEQGAQTQCRHLIAATAHTVHDILTT